MREPDLRKMLRQDVRGKFEMRPLHEFVVKRIPPAKKPELEDQDSWSFSWDGATLQYPSLDIAAAPVGETGKK